VTLWAAARHPRRWRYERIRRRLAGRVIAGQGLEIGALHSPFPVPSAATVRYVDRLTTDQLRDEYPELAGQPLVDVDVVDDGERLTSIPGQSQDFVIASHFLEHCEDPIGTLEAHLRALRPGGTLLLALPDRRSGVDSRREATTLEHLIADHEQGPQRSRAQHYRDWARLVDLPLGNITVDQVEAHAAALQQRHYSIHFHCWTEAEFADQLAGIIDRYDLPGAITRRRHNHHEFLVTLARRP
jgi:SAM-dependent methyltransferase